MNIKHIIIATLFSTTAFFAHAQESLSIDSKKEVVYQCKIGEANQTLSIMYGIKDNQIVVAQGKINDYITPALFPTTEESPTMDYYFGNNGKQTEWLWTTFPANGETIDRLDGGILAQGPIDGSQPHIILLEQCKLDKNATAKLNQN